MLISHAPFLLAAYSHLVSPTHVPQHYHEWDAIDYHAKITALCDTHVKNHRVRGTHKNWHYSRDEYKETDFSTNDQADVYGETNWLSHFSGGRFNGKPFEAVRFYTPDAQYIWEKFDHNVPFQLMQHHLEWQDSFGWNYITFGGFLASQQFARPMPKEKLVSHELVVFEGRDALKLVTKWERQTTTLHVARDTYQLLQQEYHSEPTKDAGLPDKVVTRLTYRDAGGKRYPTASTTTVHHADGTSRKRNEIVFTEYTPYTPTADDHDLPKRFGIELVEHEPRPPVESPPPVVWPPRTIAPAGPVADSRTLDEPPIDHTTRYLIAGCVGGVIGVILSFRMGGKPKP